MLNPCSRSHLGVQSSPDTKLCRKAGFSSMSSEWIARQRKWRRNEWNSAFEDEPEKSMFSILESETFCPPQGVSRGQVVHFFEPA